MTILGPILMASLMVVPFLVMQIKDTDDKKVLVADQTGLFADKLKSGDHLSFENVAFAPIDSLKKHFIGSKSYALLYIEGQGNVEPAKVTLYSKDQLNMDIQKAITRQLNSIVEKEKLKGYDIANLDEILASVKTNINVSTIRWDDNGGEKESHTGTLMGVSYVASFMIYMFIFMFGSMVMRGVMEEKSNRIVEVIVSSVKPFQLMLGKILGIALVGLLQFAIWIILTIGIVTVATSLLGSDVQQTVAAQAGAANQMGVDVASSLGNAGGLSSMLDSIPFVSVIISFLLYFLGGYLLYAAMFAAIGSAVENESDTQQMVLPVTIPLIIGLFIMMHTFQYPNSSLSFWASMIPFTSPMVMMARVPFGVPVWQLALSLTLLFGTFVALTWFTGRIYRVGILMYGKKTSFKEMLKWIKYKA